jgi:PKD repeat protein
MPNTLANYYFSYVKVGLKKAASLICFVLLLGSCSIIKQFGFTKKAYNNKDEKDRIDIALLEDKESIKDPNTGEVPYDRLLSAKAYKDFLLDKKTRGAITGINWKSLGSQNQAGRSRTIHVDLTDSTGKTVWVASVGGGLWKTKNILDAQPNWTTNTQMLSNLCVSDIAQDPTNKNIMYFCTGEGNGGSGAIRGLGLWKSTDTGNTWAQLASTNNSDFYYTTKMLVLPNGNILVCTQGGGVQLSTNGGTSFNKVLGSGLGITGANSNTAHDIERAADGTLFATLSGSLHSSTNNGSTWASAITLPITANRIEIACAPSDANYIYLLVENGNVVNGILKSINKGLNWSSVSEPDDNDSGIPATDFSRGQAWYDLAIIVDPTDRESLWVGGIDLFKSSNGGNTWTQQSHWYGATYQYVHADQHEMAFDPFNTNRLYFVNDGGIDVTSNAQDNATTIEYKGYNYNTIQFYACAMHPDANVPYYLAGAQDNGTQQFIQDVFAPSYEVTGGDGAFCHIDQNDPSFQWTSYVYNNYRVSTNGGNSFTSINYDDNGRFINPTDYDNNAAIMYCAYSTNQYLIWTNPKTGSNFTSRTITQLNNARVSAVTCSPNTSNRVFLGSGSGRILRIDNANSSSPLVTNITSASMPSNTYVSCIEVENGNDNHLIAVFRNFGINSVWETTNGGSTWTSIEGNLPDVPVRWAIFNPRNSKQALVATELGVWSTDSLQGTSTVWGASNSGLANVRVDMLQTRASDYMVIAATHGRGLFLSDVFADPIAKFEQNEKVVYLGQKLQFTNTSVKANSNLWDFGDGNTSTATNPVHVYNTPGQYTVELTINAGQSTITKNNIVTVLPNRSLPYTLSNGGNFETNQSDFAADTILGTKWELGNSTVAGKNGTNSGSFAWVTGINENTYSDNSSSYLHTPMFTIPAGQNFTLSFDTKFQFEPEYDGFNIEYTIDSGATWLALGNTVQSNWYNFSNSPRVSLVFPAAQAFFTNTEANFTSKIFDLNSLAGRKVAFRFAFKTDDFVVDAGAAIDNFAISGPNIGPLNVNVLQLQGKSLIDANELSWQANELLIGDEFILYAGEQATALAEINRMKVNELEKQFYFKHNTTKENLYYQVALFRNGEMLQQSNVINLIGFNHSEVALIPNPANNFVCINGLDGKTKKIQLSDAAGKVVLIIKPNNNCLNLPSELNSGTYLMTITTTEGRINRKLQILR